VNQPRIGGIAGKHQDPTRVVPAGPAVAAGATQSMDAHTLAGFGFSALAAGIAVLYAAVRRIRIARR
jgi:hypothetical protein